MTSLPARNATRVATTTLPVDRIAVSEMWGGARRLEGEAYLMPGYVVRRRLARARAIVVPLSRLACVTQPSRLKGTLVAPSHGVPFLTATQVLDVRPRPRKWLAPSHTEALAGRFVTAGTIFVTCSGSVGTAMMAYAPHEGVVISHDILRVSPFEAEQRGAVYAFLRTAHARAMMRSSHYGNVIKHLEVEHIDALPFPILDPDLSSDAGLTVDRVFAMRDEAYALTLEAEDIYAKAIGPVGDPDAPEHGFAVRSSALENGRRRLDGYHHSPTARAAVAALRRGAREVVTLGDVTEAVFWKERFARSYTSKGVPYLHADTLFTVNPEAQKHLGSEALDDMRPYFVERGWILMACSGQIYGLNGTALLTTPWHEGKFVSHDVVRIVPKGIRPGYILTALSHPALGRPLVLRWAYGTQIPHLEPDDLVRVPVPRLAPDIEDEIADRMERAALLRYEADQDENAAVALVEQALCDLIGPVPDTAA